MFLPTIFMFKLILLVLQIEVGVWGEGIVHSLAPKAMVSKSCKTLFHSSKVLAVCLLINSLSSSGHLHMKHETYKWRLLLILIMLSSRKRWKRKLG